MFTGRRDFGVLNGEDKFASIREKSGKTCTVHMKEERNVTTSALKKSGFCQDKKSSSEILH